MIYLLVFLLLAAINLNLSQTVSFSQNFRNIRICVRVSFFLFHKFSNQLIEVFQRSPLWVHTTQWIQGKVANLKSMVSIHDTKLLGHPASTLTASQMNLTKLPLIYYLDSDMHTNKFMVLI